MSMLTTTPKEPRALRFYNTRTRSMQDFKPIQAGQVSIYSCGPTVYDFQHIGNLRAYTFVDTLKRTLQWAGYTIEHVMNLTDVGHLTDDGDAGEDKMELAAQGSGQDIWDLSRFYSQVFFEHCGEMSILPPNRICRATDHITQQIQLIKDIEARGAAYQIEDGVYLDTSKVEDYGAFAKLSLEGQKEGARVETVEGKRHPSDFALWKFSRGAVRQMEWESPWGRGFPGWHLECSAMATHYLGKQIDIHTGGIDHIPVHHTNEIAQMRAAGGAEPWVNIWMHNNFLVLEKDDVKTEQDGTETAQEGTAKMSKSSGDFLTLSCLRSWGVQTLSYRYLLLGTHYRKEARFSKKNLLAAETALKRLWQLVADRRERLEAKTKDTDSQPLSAVGSGTVFRPGSLACKSSGSYSSYYDEFCSAMTQDLNTPKALSVLITALKDQSLEDSSALNLAQEADRVLGLRLLEGPVGGDHKGSIDPKRIQSLVDMRIQARKDKNYALSDAIRDVCSEIGIVIKDTPEGMSWEWEKA